MLNPSEDINECFAGTHTCSVPGGVCENIEGGYECPRCDEGFTGPNGFNCTDINECENDPSPCNVGVECTNNDGSYHCGDCDEGFYLRGSTTRIYRLKIFQFLAGSIQQNR